jgi:hypothetical protein
MGYEGRASGRMSGPGVDKKTLGRENTTGFFDHCFTFLGING